MSKNNIVGLVAGIIILIFIEALVGLWLWNWLMPLIFGLSKVTFLQFLGLCFLTHIIFPCPVNHNNG